MGRAGIGRPGLGFGFSVVLADGVIFFSRKCVGGWVLAFWPLFWRLCFKMQSSSNKSVKIHTKLRFY
jgi:hypothetical protein